MVENEYSLFGFAHRIPFLSTPSPFFELDRVQNRLRGLMGNKLFFTLQLLRRSHNVAVFCFLYSCFHEKMF